MLPTIEDLITTSNVYEVVVCHAWTDGENRK